MPTLNVVTDTVVVQTAAQWAVDATVYINRQILVTSDAYYGSTDFRKFKIADGTQTWANIQDLPFLTSVGTLAQVLAVGALTNSVPITANNGKAKLTLNQTDAILEFTDGSVNHQVEVDLASIKMLFNDGVVGGAVSIDVSQANIYHDTEVTIDAPSILLNGAEAATQSYADAKVADSITNGVTTIAPSQNAVFDALALKQAVVSGVDDTEIGYLNGVTSAIQGQLDSKGYPLQGSCTSITTVNDATNYYFADPNIGTSTSADVVGLTIPKTAILKKAVIYAKVAGTLASAENSTIYLRLNATTDVTLSAAVTLTATTQVITSGALNQAVTAGDFFAFKFTSATFATNPTTVSFTVSLFFEYA